MNSVVRNGAFSLRKRPVLVAPALDRRERGAPRCIAQRLSARRACGRPHALCSEPSRSSDHASRGLRSARAESLLASQNMSFSTVKHARFCKRRYARCARVDVCARTRRHGSMRCATKRRIEKLCIFFVANPNKWLEGIFEMLRMSASSVLMSVTRLLSSQRVIAAAMTRTMNQGSRKSTRGVSRLAGRNGFEGVTRLRRSA